jgi:hypothetical protein
MRAGLYLALLAGAFVAVVAAPTGAMGALTLDRFSDA